MSEQQTLEQRVQQLEKQGDVFRECLVKSVRSLYRLTEELGDLVKILRDKKEA